MTKKAVEAPLGGTIIELKVNVGDVVKVDDPLFVLEAMKMENEIYAEASGVIAEINVEKGEIVEANKLIMTIEV